MRVARLNRDLTGCSRDILHKANGDHLDRVHADQKVLGVIGWGRLVLVIGGHGLVAQVNRTS
jgi:hypothetical protein